MYPKDQRLLVRRVIGKSQLIHGASRFLQKELAKRVSSDHIAKRSLRRLHAPAPLLVGQLASLVQDYVRDRAQGDAEMITGVAAFTFARESAFGN